VNKGATTLTVPAKSGSFGSSVTLTATLTRNSDNTGLSGRTVTFSVGGVAVGSGTTSASGVASFNWAVTNTVPGAYALGASFAGDASYLASSGSSTFTKQGLTAIAINSVSGQRTATVTFQATLTRTFDNAGPISRAINWTIDGVAAGTSFTGTGGIATLNYVIPAGATLGAGHTVKAEFLGDTLYVGQSTTASWQVLNPSFNGRSAFQNWIPSVAGQIVQVTVRNSADVVVQGPTTLGVDSSGSWQLFTSLGAGTYKVSVKGSHWLRRQVTGVVLNTTTGTSTIITSLINGDGVSDNVIDLSDYTQVVVAFNSAGPSGDLNGDGIVDLSDYTVVVTNFNLVGDP
ncbi:MAG: Ig-like domain repeat protein, partial [Armatimonadetes bacterium]|nr:Ig-like domain repeat protein [Armatimonadota bacterium]